MSTPTLPDATTTATNMVDSIGSQVVSVVVGVWPVLAGGLLLLGAVGAIPRALGIRKRRHVL